MSFPAHPSTLHLTKTELSRVWNSAVASAKVALTADVIVILARAISANMTHFPIMSDRMGMSIGIVTVLVAELLSPMHDNLDRIAIDVGAASGFLCTNGLFSMSCPVIPSLIGGGIIGFFVSGGLAAHRAKRDTTPQEYLEVDV